MQEETYRVEDFAPIRPHQSFHINTHFQNMMREFDAQYGLARWFERERYEEDRLLFARSIARSLADLYIHDEGRPVEIESRWEFKTAEGRRFRIDVDSTFENVKLSGNRVFSRLKSSFAGANVRATFDRPYDPASPASFPKPAFR
jgi:hypothetical protein